MSLAWHIAGLGRTKKLPKLQTLLAKKQTSGSQRQPWQQQMAIMDMWAARTRRVERQSQSKDR